MKAATEEFLMFLLCSAETLARPTWNNTESSFEGWAFRNGMGRRLQALRREQLIETQQDDDVRVVRLTSKGVAAALGGRDPARYWQRSWDGRWRMIMFDVSANARRQQLRRLLREHGWGWLQNSVWIAPDVVESLQARITSVKGSVESLVVMEGSPIGGESDTDIVQGAWDFQRINRNYAAYLRQLSHPPQITKRATSQLASLRQWIQHERIAWSGAIRHDPLLPRPLWPKNYLGENAWHVRLKTLESINNSLTALPCTTMLRS